MPNANAPRHHDMEVDLSPKYIIVAVAMMCLMLLGLYFFYDYLGISFLQALVSVSHCLKLVRIMHNFNQVQGSSFV